MCHYRRKRSQDILHILSFGGVRRRMTALLRIAIHKNTDLLLTGMFPDWKVMGTALPQHRSRFNRTRLNSCYNCRMSKRAFNINQSDTG
jgi:hypothetical protein